MWLLGMLSLLQIAVLPGAVLLRAFPESDRHWTESAAFIFALSLIANTVIVLALFSVHAYSRVTIAGVIVCELLALAIRARGWPARVPVSLAPLRTWRRAGFAETLGWILALSAVAIFVWLFARDWGSVFTQNDAVASWDRWAMEWTRGHWPTSTSWYPQLLPLNWSLSYTLMGTTDVKMFCKALGPLYTIAALLLFIGAARRRKDAGYLFGGAAYAWLLLHYLGPEIATSGYADVPVAFLTFAAFQAADGRSTASSVWLALVLGFGAVLTKPSAAYIVAYTVGAAGLLAVRGRLQWRSRPVAWVAAALVALTAVLWFGLKAIEIHAGGDYSNAGILTGFRHGGRGYLERLEHGALLFWRARENAGPWISSFYLFTLAAGVLVRGGRRIGFWLALPFVLQYGLLFSYDLRNSTVAWPFVALVSGLGLHAAVRQLERVIPPAVLLAGTIAGAAWLLAGTPTFGIARETLNPLVRNFWVAFALPMAAWPMLVAGAAALVVRWLPVPDRRLTLPWRGAVCCLVTWGLVAGATLNADEVLLLRQTAKQRRIGDARFNVELYRVASEEHIDTPIVTDYWFLQGLPDLKPLFLPTTCAAPCTFQGLLNSAIHYPEAGYILMSDLSLAPDAQAAIAEDRGLHLLLHTRRETLVRIDRLKLPSAYRVPWLRASSPAAGTGRTIGLRLTFADPNGPADIARVLVTVKGASSPEAVCALEWTREEARVTSGACSLDGPVATSTANDALELTVPLSFGASVRGPHEIYAAAVDAAGVHSPVTRASEWAVR